MTFMVYTKPGSDYAADPRIVPDKPYQVIDYNVIKPGLARVSVEVEGCERVIGYIEETDKPNPNGFHRCGPDMATPFYDLIAHLHRQRVFSLNAFGPGGRVKGICDHISKELIEVQKEKTPERILKEAIDLIGLSLDLALRTGLPYQRICDEMIDKLIVNENRTWPDWRRSDPDKAIEHDRSGE